jgi:hypothetical protein
VSQNKGRQVNTSTDKKASFGPFPARLVLPVVGIFLFSYILFIGMLGLDFIVAFLAWAGLTAVYWIFTKDGEHNAFGRFIGSPQYGRGQRRRRDLLVESRSKDKNVSQGTAKGKNQKR